LAAQVGVPLINPAAGFGDAFPEANGPTYDRDGHWTAIAHRLAARHVARELIRLGIVHCSGDASMAKEALADPLAEPVPASEAKTGCEEDATSTDREAT
jgi:hypothetical protein